MAENFSVLVSAEFDNSSVNKLQSDIKNALKGEPIPIKIDIGDAEKQINSLKQHIESIAKEFEKIKPPNIPPIGGGNGGNGSGNDPLKEYEKTYKRMLDIQKKLSNIKITMAGLNDAKNHNQLQVLESDMKELERTYKELESSLSSELPSAQFQKINSVIDDTNKKIEVLNAKLADTSLRKFDDSFGNIEKINSKFDNLKDKTAEVTTAMSRFRESVSNMNSAKQSGDIDKIVKSYNEYEQAIKNVEREINKLSNNDALNQSKNLFSLKIDNWAKGNSAALRTFGNDIERIKTELKSCDGIRLKGLEKEFREIQQQAKLAGVATQTFGDRISSAILNIPKSITSGFAMYFNSTALFTGLTNGLHAAYDNVKNIDTAFTELKKVTDETDSSYQKFMSNAASQAKEIGTTIDNYISSTADFARLGYTFTESQDMAKAANVYNVVGDEIENIGEATESIISTMQAFKDEVSDSMSVVDKFNEVSNNFAISSGGIGEAMKRSASSLAAANNTIDQSVSLITAANTVVQDPARVGTAMKTISMRIRGAKVELEEAGESTEGMAESVSSLRKEIKALSGVDIMLDDNTFRSTYDILDDLAKKWDELSDISKASITEMLAGKMQGNVMSSLLSNFDIAREALQTSVDSEGSAMAEHAKWMDSIEAKTQKFTASLQALSQDAISSDFVKSLVDSGTKLIDILDAIINKFGLIKPAIMGLSAALSLKNIGRDKLFSLKIQSLCVLYI